MSPSTVTPRPLSGPATQEAGRRGGRRIALMALLLTLALGGSATSADAETLRLRSGQTLEVASVEVLENAFRVEVATEEGADFVEIPFERFAPKMALKIFDRHTEALDPQRKIQGAELALSLGLLEEARKRFERAATLDPTFAPDAEAGLTKIQIAEAESSFRELESRLRKSLVPREEVAELKALLIGPHAGVLSEATRLRIKLLIHLGTQVIAREDERRAKKGKKPLPAPAPEKKPGDADGTPPPPPPPPTQGGVPARRTYADQRYRSRRGERPAPPKVPGTERPPSAAGGRSTGGGGGGSGLGR